VPCAKFGAGVVGLSTVADPGLPGANERELLGPAVSGAAIEFPVVYALSNILLCYSQVLG
jgi:hypothetical protein